MRGVSPLISHTLDLAIIIAVFSLIIVHVSGLKVQAEEQFLSYQTDYIATRVAEEIALLENTYADSSYLDPSEVGLYTVASVNIPVSSNMPIRVRLSEGNKIEVLGVTSSGKAIISVRNVSYSQQYGPWSIARLPANLKMQRDIIMFKLDAPASEESPAPLYKIRCSCRIW